MDDLISRAAAERRIDDAMSRVFKESDGIGKKILERVPSVQPEPQDGKKLIDGNKLVIALADWWYSSFGQEQTEESKAIKTVLEQVEKMIPYHHVVPRKEAK